MKWTPDIRKALDTLLSSRSSPTSKVETSVGKDEGVFWMSFKDFVQYFSSIDICKTRLDWFEHRRSGLFATEASKRMKAFHLIIFETSLIDIELFHKSIKNRRESCNLDLCFIVLDYRTRTFVASSKRSIKKFIHLEHMFEPGEYLIVPLSFHFWNSTNPNDQNNNMYNLVVHGPKAFFMKSECFSINLQVVKENERWNERF